MIRDRMKFTVLGDDREAMKTQAVALAAEYYGFPPESAEQYAEFEMEVSVLAPDSQCKFYADVFVRPKIK
jgi:hypothetical protein